MHILLTNDDGLDSPLLAALQEQLIDWGTITVVAPSREQSWKGKSMTRFQDLTLKRLEGRPVATFSLDGTPADCVNAGLFLICDPRPDLVVSGVNVGQNLGTAFVASSGTVGACLEANLAGLPGLALSHEMPPEAFSEWRLHQRLPDAAVHHCSDQISAVLGRLRTRLSDDLVAGPVTWNVNIPATLASDWRIVASALGHTTYGSVFERLPDGRLRHTRAADAIDKRPDRDTAIMGRRMVSMTRLDLRTLGQLGPLGDA